MAFGIAIVALLAVLTVEIWVALRREYLPTDRPLELQATFGSETAPSLRFVVLGDSTAAGVGVEDPAHAYPTLLARRLAQEETRRVELIVLGASGARVRDVLQEQARRAAGLDPDLIFIGIGANDVTHVTPPDQIRRDMRLTLQLLQETDATIVVAGAPDMRVFAWHQPLRYVAYLRGRQVTAAIEDVARSQDVAVVELADETGHFFAEQPVTHFSEDRFHPSALGYKRWADAIFPVIKEALT